jgi:hypothetical protein
VLDLLFHILLLQVVVVVEEEGVEVAAVEEEEALRRRFSDPSWSVLLFCFVCAAFCFLSAEVSVCGCQSCGEVRLFNLPNLFVCIALDLLSLVPR